MRRCMAMRICRHAAARGQYSKWEATSEGTLALLLLLERGKAVVEPAGAAWKCVRVTLSFALPGVWLPSKSNPNNWMW